MISNLPMDLVEEILSRVPLRSVRAVRLTCKKWNALSKSKSFKKMHIGKAAARTTEGESQMMVMLRDYNLYLMSVVNGIYYDPYEEDKGKLTCLNGSEQVKISHVFHSEGLLLCILKDTLRLVVWNPYLAQTRWIEPRYAFCKWDRHDWHGYRYALGYENKKNKPCHKILRFIDDYTFGQKNIWYEIYDFDSDLWTTLDVDPYWGIDFNQRGVSLKGNTYWLANSDHHIICFNFTRERFGPLVYLSYIASEDDQTMKISCVGEEKLVALVKPYEQCKIDIWITTKIEAEEISWSKFLTSWGSPIDDILFRYSDFFIDEEQNVAMVFDKDRDMSGLLLDEDAIYIIGEAGYFRKVDLGEPEVHSNPIVCSYVPSLVQIKEPVDGERKQQSDLEKHRFDQNMLRCVAIDKGLEAIHRKYCINNVKKVPRVENLLINDTDSDIDEESDIMDLLTPSVQKILRDRPVKLKEASSKAGRRRGGGRGKRGGCG